MPNGPVFKLSGEFVGFFAGGWLFSQAGLPLAWVDEADNSVWLPDGTYVGQVFNDHYVLRSTSRSPSRRAPRPTPPNHVPHAPHVSRVPHVPMAGWAEGLDIFDQR